MVLILFHFNLLLQSPLILLRNRLISALAVEERMKNVLYKPLSQLRQQMRPCNQPWAIFGVITEISQRSTSAGAKFCIFRLSDLGETNVNLFLFNKAYDALWNEVVGAVVAVSTPEICKPTEVSK